MTLAKYVAVLGSYIHNGIFVFKLKRIFLKICYAPPFFFFFFTERASCSVAHCQSPGVWLDYRSGGMVRHSCSVCETAVVCSLYSINKRPTIEYTRQGQGCLPRGSVVFFAFFSDWDITFRVLDAQWMQGRYVSCEAEGTCSPAMRTPVSPAQS